MSTAMAQEAGGLAQTRGGERPPVRPRGRRRTADTREKIVEAAGRVFAERGFDGATGKEIAELADVSAAAINYYFGGMETLHHEVLHQAYDRMVAADAFAELIAASATPEDCLLALYESMVRGMTASQEQGWAWRVISREAMAPTGDLDKLRETVLIPKMLMFRALVSELMGLPPDHPAVAQGCVSIMSPLVMLQVGDWQAIGRAFPGFRMDEGNAPQVAQRFFTFTLAGLRAMAQQEEPAGAS